MIDLYNTLSVVSLILTIGGIVGGFFAFRGGQAQTANMIQERVINALNSELNNLRENLDGTKEENTRLRLLIDAICTALKVRGLILTIDGNTVTIHDGTLGTTATLVKNPT